MVDDKKNSVLALVYCTTITPLPDVESCS